MVYIAGIVEFCIVMHRQ